MSRTQTIATAVQTAPIAEEIPIILGMEACMAGITSRRDQDRIPVLVHHRGGTVVGRGMSRIWGQGIPIVSRCIDIVPGLVIQAARGLTHRFLELRMGLLCLLLLLLMLLLEEREGCTLSRDPSPGWEGDHGGGGWSLETTPRTVMREALGLRRKCRGETTRHCSESHLIPGKTGRSRTLTAASSNRRPAGERDWEGCSAQLRAPTETTRRTAAIPTVMDPTVVPHRITEESCDGVDRRFQHHKVTEGETLVRDDIDPLDLTEALQVLMDEALIHVRVQVPEIHIPCRTLGHSVQDESPDRMEATPSDLDPVPRDRCEIQIQFRIPVLGLDRTPGMEHDRRLRIHESDEGTALLGEDPCTLQDDSLHPDIVQEQPIAQVGAKSSKIHCPTLLVQSTVGTELIVELGLELRSHGLQHRRTTSGAQPTQTGEIRTLTGEHGGRAVEVRGIPIWISRFVDRKVVLWGVMELLLLWLSLLVVGVMVMLWMLRWSVWRWRSKGVMLLR